MPLRAAADRIDITPPVGVELAGWCFGASTGVADPLYACGLMLEQSKERIVIISADLIGLGTEYADRIRNTIANELDMSQEAVIICSSHTHSGPGAMPLRRWGSIDPVYIETLIGNIIDMVLRLPKSLSAATCVAGETHVTGICRNRRRDRGSVIDEHVPVLAVMDRNTTPIAILYNVSCHPVAAHGDRNLISADFPGYAAATIRSQFPAVVPMFTLGAAGDINPVEFHKIALAESYGESVGNAVVTVMQTLGQSLEFLVTENVHPDSNELSDRQERDSSTVLAARSRTVSLPVAPLPSADFLREEKNKWKAEAQRIEQDKGRHDKLEDALIKSEWAAEALQVVESGRVAGSIDMEITVVRIGDVAIVALPGELFVEIGLSIKKHSPFPITVIATLANGSLCYLPTAEAFRTGGYETEFSAKVYGLYMLTPETQGIIERSVEELLGELAHARS